MKFDKKITQVSKPRWNRIFEGDGYIGSDINLMLCDQTRLGRRVRKIIIEVMEPTKIEYVIIPGRWIKRLYNCGFLKEGTL